MTGHTWAARAVTVDTARRVIEAVVIPYGETARVTDDGRTFYQETFEQGGATPGERVAVFGGHKVSATGVDRGPLIGRADTWTDTPEGLRAELTIANTAAGSEVLELADVLGTVHVSAEYQVPRRYQANEDVRRTKAEPVTLDGVAVILPPQRPAFAGAAGAARTDTEETTAMSDTDTTPEEDTPEEETPKESVRALVSTEVRREVARLNVGGARDRSAPPSPFAEYASFGQVVAAARELPAEQGAALSRAFHDAYHQWQDLRRGGYTASRALVNQITPDNPGVMPPAWITEVFGVIDMGRPAIDATGGPRSAGTTGLEVNWPYFDGDLGVLVGQQVAEKTEVTSVKVSLKKGTADLKTFSGGSDVSAQLERRSSPSYVETYNRIMSMAYALTTEYTYENELLAAATGSGPFDPLTANAAAWRSFLFGASTQVRNATGAPATVVLVSTDVFAAMGALPDLMPAQYGTQNVSGTSSASNLAINVSGLEITEAPGLPAASVIVTNRGAASWIEDGPFLITALDVAKLGRDIAIWGLGATAVFLPAGLVKSSATTGTTTGRNKS